MADGKLPPLQGRPFKVRKPNECHIIVGPGGTAHLTQEECDEVIRRSDAEPGLRAQNAKLVEALEKIANKDAEKDSSAIAQAALKGETPQ